ncbi:hypothetical protein E2I00_019551, partial [Balaenoptera physalus]
AGWARSPGWGFPPCRQHTPVAGTPDAVRSTKLTLNRPFPGVLQRLPSLPRISLSDVCAPLQPLECPLLAGGWDVCVHTPLAAGAEGTEGHPTGGALSASGVGECPSHPPKLGVVTATIAFSQAHPSGSLAGGVILGVALWLRHDPQTTNLLYLELGDRPAPNTFYVGIYILIAVGAVMMFVGFLGCYGAIQESQCLLAEGEGCGAGRGQNRELRLCPSGGNVVSNLLKEDCHGKIDELFSGKLYLIGIAAIVVAVIMIFEMILSMVLCCGIRNSSFPVAFGADVTCRWHSRVHEQPYAFNAPLLSNASPSIVITS